MVRVSFFSSWSGGILYCDNGVSAVQRQTTIYVMKCVQTSTGSCKSQPIKWKLVGSNVSPRDNSVSPSKPVPKAAGALFDYVNYWTSFVPTVTRGSFDNDGAAKENIKKASRASLFFGRFLSCSLRDYDVKFWNLTFYQRRKRMVNNCFVSLS